MNNTLKIVVALSCVLLIGLICLAIGMYSMDIEDTYGDNQDIFYNARHGDIVINNETKQVGRISKTWRRVYIINGDDTLNIHDWWNDKDIEIYRPLNNETSFDKLSYGNFNELKTKLEFKKRLR